MGDRVLVVVCRVRFSEPLTGAAPSPFSLTLLTSLDSGVSGDVGARTITS